jgi:hypothetical protein
VIRWPWASSHVGLGEGGLYPASGGIVCLDALAMGHTTSNKAKTDDDRFGSFTTCRGKAGPAIDERSTASRCVRLESRTDERGR